MMKFTSYMALLLVMWGYTMAADVDECATGQHNCGNVSRCRNTDGSYYCTCPEQPDTNSRSGVHNLAWGDSCYSIFTNSAPTTWDNAHQSCEVNSGDLVVIKTRNQQDWIIDQVKRIYKQSGQSTRWWYGLRRSEDNLGWQWVDGTHLINSTITWAPHEPGSTENCVEMYLDGTLNDNSCTSREIFSYICERNTAVDECTGKGICETNADCRNIPGGYNCTCSSGYEGDAANCSDIDECTENTCHIDATCENVPGAYSCACKEGFSGNGTICSAIASDEQDEMQALYIGVGSAVGLVLIVLVIVIGLICVKRRRKLERVETNPYVASLATTHEYVNVGMEGLANEDERYQSGTSLSIPANSLSEGRIEDLYSNHKIRKTRREPEDDSAPMESKFEGNVDHNEKPKPPPKPKVVMKEADSREDLYSNKYIPETKKKQRNEDSQAQSRTENNTVINEDDGYGHLYGTTANAEDTVLSGTDVNGRQVQSGETDDDSSYSVLKRPKTGPR